MLQGVRAVINMCAEYAGPEEAYKQLGIHQLRLPTDDHYEPLLADMKAAVNFIAECKGRNEKVYIHCKAGHGRAASIAFAWLMYTNPNADPEVKNAYLLLFLEIFIFILFILH
jgi:atypical dual specificity phosphatase